MAKLTSPASAAFHVGVVGCFAISQPLFDLLGRHPEFLLAHRVSGSTLIALALALVLGPLALTAPIIGLASIASRRLGLGVAQGLLAILVAATVLPIIRGGPAVADSTAMGVALAAGLAVAFLYPSLPLLRQLLTVLGGVFLVFPVLFLLFSPAAELLAGEEDAVAASDHVERPAPIVLLIFDEFPVISLLDRGGLVDSRRYPHFAALAKEAIWYRNTSSVAIFTQAAVPAILTGILPEKPFPLATYENLPRNIYSLLGDHYRIHDFEPLSNLCPERLCQPESSTVAQLRLGPLLSDLSLIYLHRIAPAELAAKLPSVTDNWRDFGRATGKPTEPPRSRSGGRRDPEVARKNVDMALSTHADFRRFLSEIERPRPGRPALHVFHMLVPHPPWHYLPSGHRYPSSTHSQYGLGTKWSGDLWETVFAYQRHLLQVGFADRMLGRLVRRLRALGIYDDALVVITADHGAGFVPGRARRSASRKSVAESLMVPLFIKLPGTQQGRAQRGRIDDRALQTIDILPTIADAIGAELPWAVDGHSALAEDFPVREVVTLVHGKSPKRSIPVDSLLTSRDKALARKMRIFGRKPGNQGLYYIGEHLDLLGKSISQVPLIPNRAHQRVRIYGARLFLDVNLDAVERPTLIEGQLIGVKDEAGSVVIAIAINDRIAAVARSHTDSEGRLGFAAMIPESALVNGRNRVEVLKVMGSPGEARLRPIERTLR